MKVKIGDTLYDSNQIPVMLVLSDEDKENLANMDPEANSFCSYPSGMNADAIHTWMEKEPRIPDPEELMEIMGLGEGT